ncbi:MAG TPA: hypothetical protein VJR89_29260, partial [Polyangiales bacterium]|nr:hypothetical protein [Polyangiales bacterium]
THLLLQKYARPRPQDRLAYVGSVVVDPLGAVMATPNLPAADANPRDFGFFDRPEQATIVDANQLYIARTNAIYEVSSGNVVWQGPPVGDSPRGTVAAGFVVFSDAAKLRVQTR